jgi:ubiquitin C-terminal hydrolase
MGAGCSSKRDGKIREPTAPPSPPPEIHEDYAYLDNTFELKREEETKYGKASLDNVGNTCAFNAVLQALIHTAPLADYFMARVFEHELNLSNANGTNGEMVRALYDIIRTTWTDVYEIIIPKTINKLFKKHKESYRKSEQSDAHEFFMFIFNLLHEDLKRSNPVAPRAIQPIAADQAESMARLIWKEEISLNDSVLTDLFRGQFRSQVRCLKCGYVSFRYDSFTSLALETRLVPCSLGDCLNDFTEVSNVSGFLCSGCNSRTEGMMKTEINRAPHILVVVLKRFKAERKKLSKLEHLVTFPTMGLDLSRYMSEPSTQVEYELYAKVDHVGSLKSGHYTAAVRNRKVMKWFEYDDDKIADVEETTLVKASTYMLFYYNKSLERYDRANPPAISAAHKPSQRPIKQVYEASVKQQPVDDYDVRKPVIKKSKAPPPMPDDYDPRNRDDPRRGYGDIPLVDSHRGFDPKGGRDPRRGYEEDRSRGYPVDVNSYTVKPFDDSFTSNSSQVTHTPSIIMRSDDPNDYEHGRYQPPSAFFGVVEQPTVSRTRRQPPRRKGESSYYERYL